MSQYDDSGTMNEIYPGLWLGDLKAGLDNKLLLEHNITCVINCTAAAPFCSLGNIKKIRISVKDNLDPQEIYKMYSSLDKAAILIYKLLPNHNILVHCYAGVQRSVAVIAAFFMKYTSLDKNLILQCISSKRAIADGLNFTHALDHYSCDLGGSYR